MTVWDVTDALKDLVDAVIASMKGAPRVTCIWEDDDERGQYRWVLEREGDEVRITILWLVGAFNRRFDDTGTSLWTARYPVRKLAMVVLNELWRLLGEWGIDSYRRASRRFDFPLVEYRALEELIRA